MLKYNFIICSLFVKNSSIINDSNANPPRGICKNSREHLVSFRRSLTKDRYYSVLPKSTAFSSRSHSLSRFEPKTEMTINVNRRTLICTLVSPLRYLWSISRKNPLFNIIHDAVRL